METQTTQQNSLRRTLGKATATLLTTAMIVGTGLFTSLGAAAAEAKSGVLLAMLIGGVIALLTGISAAQVGVNYHKAGGAFIWNRDFGFKNISFASGCAYLLDGMIGLAVLALGFATYTAQIIPGLPIVLIACIAMIIVALFNYFGIGITGKVLIGIFFFNILLLSGFVIFSLPQAHAANLTPIIGSGWGSVLQGAAIFFWTWDGFQRTAIMAAEIKEPKKTIPFAIIVGISMAAIIYLIVAATTLGVLGPNDIGTSDAAVYRAAAFALGKWGGWIILLSAWMTSFSEMLGDLLSTSRVAFAMGDTHELPHWMGTLHKRFNSPHNALIVLTIICITLILLFPIRTLMPFASACTLVWYIATHFSALQLKKEQRFAPILVTWIGLIACVGLLASLPILSSTVSVAFLFLLMCGRWLLIQFHLKAVH